MVRWPCWFHQNGIPLIFQFSLLMSSFMYRSIRFYFLYCPPRNWCLPTTISCFDNLSSYTVLLFLSLCSLFGFKWVPSKYSKDSPTKLCNERKQLSMHMHHPAQATIFLVLLVFFLSLFIFKAKSPLVILSTPILIRNDCRDYPHLATPFTASTSALLVCFKKNWLALCIINLISTVHNQTD